MTADPDEFNVLNHGDCWMNNLLFKLDTKGEVEDMLFVDFQNPKYGSPTQDLFYLILTSVHIDYKLDYFEYFIRHYHEQLTQHLDLLGFTGKQPSLRELHMLMYKHGSWAVFPSIGVLPIVLLDPNESATFENFLGDSNLAPSLRTFCTPTNAITATLKNCFHGWTTRDFWRLSKLKANSILLPLLNKLFAASLIRLLRPKRPHRSNQRIPKTKYWTG